MKCNIKQVGKYRNGKPKYFCFTHKCFLSKLNGKCECNSIEYKNVFEVDINEFKGIGVWGFLKPVYDTTKINNLEMGVHLHLRKEENQKKIVDDTFDKVIFKKGNKYIGEIKGDIAKAYTLTKTAGLRLEKVYCKYCGALHTDKGYLAVFPHKKHLCFNCGREFFVKNRNISNEILEIVDKIEVYHTRKYIKSKKVLNIKQKDFEGGIKIWSSNPAILWTLNRPEEEGIHIHCYDRNNNKVIDDTFGKVIIDNIELDYWEVRTYMAQSNVDFLNKKVASKKCANCNKDLFYTGEEAFVPKTKWKCKECSYTNKFNRRYILNPIIDKLKLLRETKKG